MKNFLYCLTAVAIIFWTIAVQQYLSFYAPFMYYASEILEQGNSVALLDKLGSEIGYIWLNFAKIGLFASISTALFAISLIWYHKNNPTDKAD